jgi:hypothetical protein
MRCIDGGFWYFTQRYLAHYMPPDGSRTLVVEACMDPHIQAHWSSITGGQSAGARCQHVHD